MIDWHKIGESSLSKTAVCAGASSVITKGFLYPMDTLKTRRQAGRNVVPRSGYFSFIRGIYGGFLPKISLYAPYQTVYMSTYTFVRDRIGSPGISTFVLAGTCAELSGAVIRLPMEVIKQRMQVGMYKNSRESLSVLLRNSSTLVNRRNFVAQTIIHDIPCGAVHWTVYETHRRLDLPGGSSTVSGAIAGTVTALVTNPVDVIKTRMITRPTDPDTATISSTVRSIARDSWRGFYRGVGFRIFHIAPSSAIYMTIFDYLYKIE